MKTEFLAGSSGTYRKVISGIPYEAEFVVAKTTSSDTEKLPVLFVGGSEVCLVPMKDIEITETIRE